VGSTIFYVFLVLVGADRYVGYVTSSMLQDGVNGGRMNGMGIKMG